MRTKSLVSHISASTTDRIFSHVTSFVYFFLIAAWMPKSEMGIYVFCLAAAQFTANLLTLGTDPIVVRRIAGRTSSVSIIAGNALLQRLAFPVAFAALVLPVLFLWPEQIKYPWLLAIAFVVCSIGQIATVNYQVLIGEQRFWWAALVQQAGAIAKLVVGLTLIALGYGALGLFVALLAGSVITIISSFIIVRSVLGVSLLPRLSLSEFWSFIKEGLPLMFARIFSQTLARIDWVLMGAMRTVVETGEYAFAYRLFELSWLPHAIWGTLLLPKVSAALRSGQVTVSLRERLTSLNRVVVAISVVIPLMMVVAWTPVVDYLTVGKYGAVNERIILVLAVVVPFAAGTGMLWNVAMALRKTVAVMSISFGVSLINIGLNIVLIPKLGGLGAAISTCIPMILQYFGFLAMMRSAIYVRSALMGLAYSVGSGLAAFGIAYHFVAWWPLKIVVALAVYGVLIWLTRTAGKEHWKRMLNRGR